MQYTVFVMQKPDTVWQAVVPALPNCVAEAPTRGEALNQIQQRIAEVASHIEVLRVQGPEPANPSNGSVQPSPQTPWDWFGKFKDDTAWGLLFDDIEQVRNANMTGE